jgi:thiol-disulfide isomerase/thioredoxin
MRRLLIAIVAVALVGGCGGGSQPAADPVALAPPPPGLPGDLAALRSEAGELLGGGADGFQARLDELEGTPVVVNKWASWCAPCRTEFPHFRAQAEERQGEVAFLGVNSGDNDADAAAFLDESPVPYPSYLDPDLDIASIVGGSAFPTTAFYDADGERVYVKQGGYATEEQLAADIERYAGG